MRVAILNTSICTTFGEFSYRPIDLANARTLIASNGYESYIGHQATADILSTLLGISVCVNRGEYIQQGGLIALVFKLNSRLTEVRDLTIQDINKIGYTLGTLTRTDNAGIV